MYLCQQLSLVYVRPDFNVEQLYLSLDRDGNGYRGDSSEGCWKNDLDRGGGSGRQVL